MGWNRNVKRFEGKFLRQFKFEEWVSGNVQFIQIMWEIFAESILNIEIEKKFTYGNVV